MKKSKGQTMDIPHAFVEFCGLALNQDFGVIYGTLENATSEAFQVLSVSDQEQLLFFLKQLSSKDISEKEVSSVLEACNSEIYLVGHSSKDLVTHLLDIITNGPPQKP